MAAIDLATIRAAVRFRGDYQNVRKFPDADLDREIQGAFGEFWELVADVHEGYWDTQGLVTTVASQAYIGLPADAWRVLGVDRLDGSEYVDMVQIPVSARNDYGSTNGEPSAYRLTARGVDLYPTPDAAYTLRVFYTPKAPDLQEAQPREWFNGWEDYVIVATLRRLDERENKPLNERMAVLEKLEKRIRRGANERRSAEPEYLALREGDPISPADKGVF